MAVSHGCQWRAIGRDAQNQLEVEKCVCAAAFVRRVVVAATRVASATGKIRRTFITMLLRSAAAGRFLRVPVRMTARPRLYGQVNKRIRWMPWQLKAMKDVAACDKPRGVGNRL